MQKTVLVERMPVSCPTNEQALWNAHPKVYLPIDATGEAVCPYCGAVYRLINPENTHAVGSHV